MSEMSMRFAVLLLVVALTLVIVWVARFFVEGRRRALAAAPVVLPVVRQEGAVLANAGTEYEARVCILAFSSEDSRQCRQLQAPVLRRVVEACGDEVVTVINIDVLSNPELTERYQVLTVPTTVLLDGKGKAHSVNYGFTNAQSLLKQVDEILALDEYATIV